MSKRKCLDDETLQPIKKQQNSSSKARHIRSKSKEKTLQLLYEGAAKHDSQSSNNSNNEKKVTCCTKVISAKNKCFYCENRICPDCSQMCYKCSKLFCTSCTFQTYNSDEAVYCYWC